MSITLTTDKVEISTSQVEKSNVLKFTDSKRAARRCIDGVDEPENLHISCSPG